MININTIKNHGFEAKISFWDRETLERQTIVIGHHPLLGDIEQLEHVKSEHDVWQVFVSHSSNKVQVIHATKRTSKGGFSTINTTKSGDSFTENSMKEYEYIHFDTLFTGEVDFAEDVITILRWVGFTK